MNPVNRQIRRWLDAGRAKEALIGSDDYFVPSSSYVGEHDIVLVLNQLLTWAEESGRLVEAASALEGAVSETAAGRNAVMAYNILWAYFLVSADRRIAIPLRRTEIDSSLILVDPPEGVPSEIATRVRERIDQLPPAGRGQP